MGMISGLVRWAGIAAASIMLLSFVLFATDQSADASKGQVTQVQGHRAPTIQQEQSQNTHNKFRQKLDKANAKLAKPFDPLTKNISSAWLSHGLTALLGVLVFGLGFAWLANLLPKPKMREPTPWHT